MCAIFFGTFLSAQDNATPSPIIFICDASGSMWGQMEGKTKMQIATDVLSTSVNNLPDNQKIGLVAYGHREKGDCEDVEFLVAVANDTKTQINESLKGIKPLGKTPLAYSALQVIDLLKKEKMKATIILVTDGIESCDGDICEVVKAAKAEGVDFRLHIIGFGLKDDETEQLKCAAQAGDGQYYDAADAGGLSDVLDEATTASVDKPAFNTTIYAVKNGKPIDAYIKAYRKGTQDSPAAARSYQDTAKMYLPPGIYDLKVQPLGGSSVNAITLTGVEASDDKIVHRDASFDSGKIELLTTNNGEGWDAVVKIFPHGENRTAAGGRTYGRAKVFDLDPGTYDVQVEAMVLKGADRIHRMEEIEVKPNETVPVSHNFESGIAMIGIKTGGEFVDAMVSVNDSKTQKNVDGGRTYTSESSNPRKFQLSPGTYDVIMRTLGKHKGKTETFTIVVKPGETVEKLITY